MTDGTAMEPRVRGGCTAALRLLIASMKPSSVAEILGLKACTRYSAVCPAGCSPEALFATEKVAPCKVRLTSAAEYNLGLLLPERQDQHPLSLTIHLDRWPPIRVNSHCKGDRDYCSCGMLQGTRYDMRSTAVNSGAFLSCAWRSCGGRE